MPQSKLLSLFLCFCLILEQSVFAQTIDLSHYFARNPTQTIPHSDKFRPLHLRYISYDNQANDFKILLDKGDFFNQKTERTLELEQTTQELMKYFFIGLALPNEKFWVNLRPDSPDNILDPDLEKTDIGRIFLEADLQLKKDTSSMTSPQTKEGREYWDKLYKKAGELFGSENITIPTITRPWIVPNEIIIREASDNAYIYKATLKVMLEEDYLDQKTEKPKNGKTEELKNQRTDWHSFSDPRLKELNQYSTQLIKEIIIPKLTYEVNISKRYAQLRQVYYSLILAQWFKQKYGGLGSARAPGTRAPVNSYVDQIDSGNLINLTSKEPYDKQTYFRQYQKSFQDGEYNLQEPVYTPMGQSIRRYMSGGIMVNGMNSIIYRLPAKTAGSSIYSSNKNNVFVAIQGNKVTVASPVSDIKQTVLDLLIEKIKPINNYLSRFGTAGVLMKNEYRNKFKNLLKDRYGRYWFDNKKSTSIKLPESVLKELAYPIAEPQAIEVIRSFIFDNPLKEEEYYEYARMKGLLKENNDYRVIFEEIAENALTVMGFNAWEIEEMINSALVVAVPDSVVDQDVDKSYSRLFDIIRILYDRRHGIVNQSDITDRLLDILLGRLGHGANTNDGELRQEVVKLLPDNISMLADYIVKKYLEAHKTSFSACNFRNAGHKNILFIKVAANVDDQEVRRHIAAEAGHAILQHFTDKGIRICSGLHETFDALVQMFIGEKIGIGDDSEKVVKMLEGLSTHEMSMLTRNIEEEPREAMVKWILGDTRRKYYAGQYNDHHPDNIISQLQNTPQGYRLLLEKTGFTQDKLNKLFAEDRIFVSHAVGAVNAHRLVKEMKGSVIHALGVAGEVLRSVSVEEAGTSNTDVFRDYREFHKKFSEIVSDINVLSKVKRRTALVIPSSEPRFPENVYEPFKGDSKLLSASSAVEGGQKMQEKLTFQGFGDKTYPEILKETITLLQEEAKNIEKIMQELGVFEAYNDFKEVKNGPQVLLDKLGEWHNKIGISNTEKKVNLWKHMVEINYDFRDKLRKAQMHLSLFMQSIRPDKKYFESVMDAYIKLLSDIKKPSEVDDNYALIMDESKIQPQLSYHILFQYKKAFQNGMPKVSSPLDADENKGGIAFNALPIQTESVASSALGVLPGGRVFNGDLDAEWARIQDVFNAGIRPSIQRLSEYTAAASASPLAEDKIDQVRVMLADILRRDEESQKPAPAEESCKQLLRALENVTIH